MDYYKIKKCIREHLEKNKEKVSDRAEARVVRMSQKGYLAMMKNHTLTVARLEEIAEILNKPVSYFFLNEEKKEPAPYLPAAEPVVIKEGPVEVYSCPECRPRVKRIQELEEKVEKLGVDVDEYRRKYIDCLEDLAGKKKAVS